MIIAENFNIKESLLFSIAARETLCLLVNKSKVPYKTELKSFVINEASNYQVMSLILDGEFPLNESSFNELVLFERIRIEVKENKDFICELFGADIYDDVTKKIDSLGPKFSNIKALLEAMSDKDFFDVKPGKVQSSKYKIDPKIKDMMDSAKKTSDNFFKKDLAAGELKPKYAISSPSPKVSSVVSKIQPKPVPQINKVIPKKQPISTIQTKKAVEIRAGITKSFDNLKQQASSATNAVSSFVKAHPAEISGVLLAVLAIYVSAKIYKRFYSKSAKACSSHKGQKKTICMKKHQLTAYRAQLVDLQKAATKCGLTKSPEKCVKTIKNKMDKINKKISKAV